jgi:hypothetical protein
MKTARHVETVAFITLLAILFTASPCPAQQPEHHDDIIPQIKMDNVPLPDAIRNLARQAGFNYIIDPRVTSSFGASFVTTSFENISAKEALDKILSVHHLVRIESPATTVSRIAPANLGIKPVSGELLKTDTNTATPLIMMEEVPLDIALENLGRQLNLKINLDEKINAGPSISVSLRWTNITVKQALMALLDNYDLVMTEEAGTAKITPKNPVAQSKSP